MDIKEMEKNFKRLLDQNSDKICINAIEYLLEGYEKSNIDTTNMRKMVKEKEKVAQCYILPLEPPKDYFSNLMNIKK